MGKDKITGMFRRLKGSCAAELQPGDQRWVRREDGKEAKGL